MVLPVFAALFVRRPPPVAEVPIKAARWNPSQKPTHLITTRQNTQTQQTRETKNKQPVNEFVKRVRALKIHMLLIGHIRRAMPAMFGKEKAQRRVLEQLPDVFYAVSCFCG